MTNDFLMNAGAAVRLTRIARFALYRGGTAARIVQRTREAPLEGPMTMADLAGYRPVKREPICRPYRAHRVCAPPPPSSGVGLLELLGMGKRFRDMRFHDKVNQVQLLTMSAVDFLDQWFETDVLKATMSASGIIGTFLGVRSPGTAYVLLHHYMGEIDGAFVWGTEKADAVAAWAARGVPVLASSWRSARGRSGSTTTGQPVRRCTSSGSSPHWDASTDPATRSGSVGGVPP